MPTPTPTPEAAAPEVVEPKAGEVDDLGYTTPEEKAEIKLVPDEPEVVKPTEEKKDEEPTEDTTGYGKEDDPKTPEAKPAEKTAEELAQEKKDEENKTDEEKAAELVQVNIKKSIEALPESVNKDVVSKFAEDNGLTDVQVEAYVKLAQADHDSLVVAQAEAVKKQRSDWKGELQGDPEFGGENFDKNVDRVNKVLDKYMPDTKKILTERGTMLPPYIMRDFLKLDSVLNPKTKLPVGEPPAVVKEEVSLLDELYS